MDSPILREKKWSAIVVEIAELKYIGVLQKEVALLRKEQTEACQVDLPIIDFSGGEIGIDCQ